MCIKARPWASRLKWCINWGIHWCKLRNCKIDVKMMQPSIMKSSLSTQWRTLVSGFLRVSWNLKWVTVTPIKGTKWEGSRENWQFSTNKSPYLRNGAISPIGTFNCYQNQRHWMTLNGCTALYCTNDASFRAQHGNLKEVRSILPGISSRNVVHGLLLSDNIRFMLIFLGVPWWGGLRRQCGHQNQQSLVISAVISSGPLELKLILLCSIMKYFIGFIETLKYLTLNDLQMPFYAKICFHHVFH